MHLPHYVIADNSDRFVGRVTNGLRDRGVRSLTPNPEVVGSDPAMHI